MTSSNSSESLLIEQQRLPTSGARAMYVFALDGATRLAIPQLAVDRQGYAGGDEWRRQQYHDAAISVGGGRFVADGTVAVPGGEDATAFRIGDCDYLATASIRTGAGPYELNCESTIFRRDQAQVRQSFQRNASPPLRPSSGITFRLAAAIFWPWLRVSFTKG